MNEYPHCFCLEAEGQHMVPMHKDFKCCWCGDIRCHTGTGQPVPGHGPLAFTVTWNVVKVAQKAD